MQAFKKVDMESWPRREHYRYYTEALRRCEALKNASDPAEYERIHYFNAV